MAYTLMIENENNAGQCRNIPFMIYNENSSSQIFCIFASLNFCDEHTYWS